jgi:hypothetical protein
VAVVNLNGSWYPELGRLLRAIPSVQHGDQTQVISLSTPGKGRFCSKKLHSAHYIRYPKVPYDPWLGECAKQLNMLGIIAKVTAKQWVSTQEVIGGLTVDAYSNKEKE